MLHEIAWDFYERCLAEIGDRRIRLSDETTWIRSFRKWVRENETSHP